MQHGLFRRVAKSHILQPHLAPHRLAIAIRLPPLPLLTVLQQPHLAVVLLRLLIQQRKNALSPGQSQQHIVKLLGNLSHRLGKLPGQLQKGRNSAQIQPAVNCQHRTQHGSQSIMQIGKIHHHRHQNIGKGVGIGGSLAKLQIQTVKILLAGLLMLKHLDHFLAANHFFHITV